MIAVRWIVRPVGVCVMRRDQPDSAAGFRNTVKLADEGHHVRNMLDDVAGDDQIEFVVGKGIRKVAEVVDHIGGRFRVIIEPDSAFEFVRTAADIKDLHR